MCCSLAGDQDGVCSLRLAILWGGMFAVRLSGVTAILSFKRTTVSVESLAVLLWYSGVVKSTCVRACVCLVLTEPLTTGPFQVLIGTLMPSCNCGLSTTRYQASFESVHTIGSVGNDNVTLPPLSQTWTVSSASLINWVRCQQLPCYISQMVCASATFVDEFINLHHHMASGNA